MRVLLGNIYNRIREEDEMNIRVEEPEKVLFSKLSLGDVFKFDHEYFLVIESIECEHGQDINAICISGNYGVTFDDNENVELVDHELIIK